MGQPSQAVRVLDGTLIVPPFECAWLTGEGYELRDNGCVTFEARGETDVTVLLKPAPGRGTKRVQPLALHRSASAPNQPAAGVQGAAAPAGALQQPGHTPSETSGLVGNVEPNYTVILGSHRNSCLKIEKNGSTVIQVHGVPGARVSAREFQAFWVDWHAAQGVLTVGSSHEPGPDTVSYQWVDPDPIPGISSVGLSCWDRHVSYRNIVVLPGLKFKPPAPAPGVSLQGAGVHSSPQVTRTSMDMPPVAPGPQSLLSLCMQAVAAGLGHTSLPPCRAAIAAELLLPNTRPLYRACLDYLARNFSLIASGLQASAAGHAAASLNPPADTAGGGVVKAGEVAGSHSSDVGSTAVDEADGSSDASASSNSARSQEAVRSGSGAPAVAAAAAAALTAADGFCDLPAPVVCDLLQSNAVPVGEKVIFDAAMVWATHRAHGSRSNSAELPHPSITSAPLERKVGSAPSADPPPAPPAGDAGTVVEGSTQFAAAQLQASAFTGGAGPAGVGDGELPEDVCRVLGLIRYPLMTLQDLQGVMAQPLVMSQPLLRALVLEALTEGQEGVSSPSRAALPGNQDGTPSRPLAPLSGLLSSPAGPSSSSVLTVENRRLLHCPVSGDLSLRASMTRFQRRIMPASHECGYVCDGDTNGVLRFIGTVYGTQPWVNPVLSRRVEVRASSPAGRHTDPKALAGDAFPRINFAGPRYVGGQPDTWWQVDLGAAHTLIPTYVSLRTDGSGEFVRSWVLQGSQDGLQWTDLQSHHNDPTFKRPGQWGSWAVRGPVAKAPYRVFRLLLTGPNTSAHTPYTFPLAHLELYGVLQLAPTPTSTAAPPTSTTPPP